jgi:hypothetical protein
LDERKVLVVAEPGMGKSSTTTQVAWDTKLADPTSWVVRINWNDHTRELQKINTAQFNFDYLLNSSAVLQSLNQNIQTLTGVCSNRHYNTVEM